MKNKRLLMILIIFGVLTFFVVLGSTVFSVSNISIEWHTTTNQFSLNDNDAIIKSGKFKKESVFLIDKDKYVKTLEKENPYLNVLKIETVFPNKLIVHVSERSELYALKVADSENAQKQVYVVMDKHLKVLDIVHTHIEPNTFNPIILEIEDNNYVDTDFSVGEFAVLFDSEILKVFDEEVFLNGYNAINLFKNIKIKIDIRVEIVAIANNLDTNGDVEMIINDADLRLPEKVNMLLSAYDYAQQNSITITQLNVFVQDGIVKVGGLS